MYGETLIQDRIPRADAQYAANYTETDYTISYSRKFGILQVTPGYIYYGLGAPYAGAIAPLDAGRSFFSPWVWIPFCSRH